MMNDYEALLTLRRWFRFRNLGQQHLNLVLFLPVLPQLVQIYNGAHDLLDLV